MALKTLHWKVLAKISSFFLLRISSQWRGHWILTFDHNSVRYWKLLNVFPRNDSFDPQVSPRIWHAQLTRCWFKRRSNNKGETWIVENLMFFCGGMVKSNEYDEFIKVGNGRSPVYHWKEDDISRQWRQWFIHALNGFFVHDKVKVHTKWKNFEIKLICIGLPRQIRALKVYLLTTE